MGRAGHVFDSVDEALLELLVMPQLIEKGVDVKNIHIEMRDRDSTHLRLSVGTEEAKLKLLAMGRLDFTDQIVIILSDTIAVTYPVTVIIFDTDRRGAPKLGELVAPASLTSLRPVADYIRGHFNLRCVPVFAKDRVVLTETLCFTLNCGCPEDANTLLQVKHGLSSIGRFPDVRMRNAYSGPLSGWRLFFYKPGLQAVVTNEDASAMLCKLDPNVGQVAIERATDVRVSIVEAAWASGQVLVTANGTRDYDVLVHGKQRILAGQQLAFGPLLYPTLG